MKFDRMPIDRRRFIAMATGAAGATATAPQVRAASAAPAPTAASLDAAHFGLRPGHPDDQSRALQRAIDEAARSRTPLALPPGVYRVGQINLAPGTCLAGARGATILALTQGPSLLAGVAADHVTLSGLVLDGGGLPQVSTPDGQPSDGGGLY